MRVLFVQQQPCIRTLKYAAALRQAQPGIRVGFAYRGRTLGEWYGRGDDLFDAWWRLTDPEPDLSRIVADFGPALIHCHNLPDALTVAALSVSGGAIPVVHDVHDLQSLRHTPYEDGFEEPSDPAALERLAVEGCDALVTVSDELLAEIEARHRLPARTLVFPNYALARDLPTLVPAVRRRGHQAPYRLVYQGTLSTNGGHYDLREIFAAVARRGLALDVYPSRPQTEYRTLAPGVRLHRRLPPDRLLGVLGRYDLGWAGFNDGLNREHLDTVLPNKLFEYLGCGLPVLTLRHRALARFVEDEGVGIALEGLDDLPARLEAADLVALRERVAAVRSRYTFEANIHRLVGLYELLTGSGVKPMPVPGGDGP
ncbi:MAG: glycosyltransferase [Actinomycetota bacterium]